MSNPNITSVGQLTAQSITTSNISCSNLNVTNNFQVNSINNCTSQNLQSLDTTTSIAGSLSSVNGLVQNKLDKNGGTLTNGFLSNCKVGTSNVASEQYVSQRINDLVGNASPLLDTLYEINQSLNFDPSFNSTMINQLATKANAVDLSNNYYSKSVIDNSLNSLNTSLNNSINNLSNNYYNKSQIDNSLNSVNTSLNNSINNLSNNYYNKTHVDSSFNVVNSSITSTNTILSNNYYNKSTINDKLDGIDQTSVDIRISKDIVSTREVTAFEFTTANNVFANNIETSNANNILRLNNGKVNAVTCVVGRLGINETNPINTLQVVGDSTFSGSVAVTNTVNANDYRINNGVPLSSQLSTLEYTRIKAFGKLRIQVFPSVVISVEQVGLASYAIDSANGTLYFTLNSMTVHNIVLCQIVETSISQATYGGWTTTATGSFSYGGNTFTHRITCWVPPANQVFTSTVAQKQIQNFDFSVL